MFFDKEILASTDGYQEFPLSLGISSQIRDEFCSQWKLHNNVELCSETALELLRNRWNTASFSVLKHLSQSLIEYTPTSLIDSPEHYSLLCVSAETQYKWQDHFFIPEPVPMSVVQANLKQHGFDSPLLSEFIALFGGLRHDFTDDTGSFVCGNEQYLLYQNTFIYDLDPRPEWVGSIVIYNSLCGNVFIVHPDGRVAWIDSVDVITYPYCDTFEKFLWAFTSIRHSFKILSADESGNVKLGNLDLADTRYPD